MANMPGGSIWRLPIRGLSASTSRREPICFGHQTFANSNQSFNTSLYGARPSVGTPLTENLGVSWNYSIYNQGLSLDPALGTASLPIQLAAQAGSYWVSSIGNTVTYSTLDNAKNPTSGFRAQTTNEFAGLGGAAQLCENHRR